MFDFTDRLVTYEHAALLKQLGFQQKETNSGYHTTEMVYGIDADENGDHHICHRYPACYEFDRHICAPTQNVARRWIKEMYHLDIFVESGGNSDYNVRVHGKWLGTGYKTYDDAMEDGIDFILVKKIYNDI